MNPTFNTVATNIRNRRTTKPGMMDGQSIPDQQINDLLALADWAPTHGNTEPWRFVVYGTDKVIDFCATHATMYKENTPAESFKEPTYENLLHMGDKASHIIIAIMHRGDLPGIPEWEEQASTAAAVQNLLLGAQALGIAAYWGTGGQATKPAMKAHLNLREEDKVMGILYLGHTDTTKEGTRKVPLEQKITWA